MTSPAVSKKNAKSNPPALTLQDVRKLLAESEERIIMTVNSKFEALCSKIDKLDSAVNEIKAIQVHQEAEIENIKTVIVKQQQQIEAFEERERQCNLIISNLPETDVVFNKVTLTDDEEKISCLLEEILDEEHQLSSSDIEETRRIGRPGRRPRLLKVRLSDAKSKYNILRASRKLNSVDIRNSFGRIYINKDLSFLRRQEERRLREQYKELRASYPGSAVALRNGKLFLGPAIKDQVNYYNLLF